MKALSLIGRALEFPKGGIPKAILVLPGGKNKVTSASVDEKGEHPEIECSVTRRSALHVEAARQTLVAQGREPFFDYCHEGILGTNDRKSGRPTRFWWDENRGVMADVEWTDAAEKSLTGKLPEYDAFSPHVPIGDADSQYPGEALGLYQNSGGVVNIGTFGRKVKFSESADMQQLIAADPTIVAQLDAALRDETQPAAGDKKETMKQLIAKLCAAFNITKAVDQVTEADLIAAFEQSQASVQTLTARAALAEPVIVALGFEKTATPKAAELTGKIADLSKRDGLITIDEHVEALTGIALSTGLIAPAESDTWKRRLKGTDRVTETKELIGKKPTVPIGTVVPPAAAGPAAGAKPSWQTRVDELIGKDPKLTEIAGTDRARAVTLAMERLVKEEPALFTPAKK